MQSNSVAYREIPRSPEFPYGCLRRAHELFDSEGHCSFSFVKFDPGESGPLHYHENPVEEFYLVLEGELEILVDEKTYHSEEGDVLYIPPETPHQPSNQSSKPAELLGVTAPPDTSKIVILDEESVS